MTRKLLILLMLVLQMSAATSWAEVISNANLTAKVLSIAPEKIVILWDGKRAELPRSIIKSERLLSGKTNAILVDGPKFQEWYYRQLIAATTATDARDVPGAERGGKKDTQNH